MLFKLMILILAVSTIEMATTCSFVTNMDDNCWSMPAGLSNKNVACWDQAGLSIKKGQYCETTATGHSNFIKCANMGCPCMSGIIPCTSGTKCIGNKCQ